MFQFLCVQITLIFTYVIFVRILPDLFYITVAVALLEDGKDAEKKQITEEARGSGSVNAAVYNHYIQVDV